MESLLNRLNETIDSKESKAKIRKAKTILKKWLDADKELRDLESAIEDGDWDTFKEKIKMDKEVTKLEAKLEKQYDVMADLGLSEDEFYGMPKEWEYMYSEGYPQYKEHLG